MILTTLFDILLFPFDMIPAFYGLCLISFIVGGLTVYLFGKLSNQESIKVVRERIRGNLLAVRLYRNDTGVILRSQVGIILDLFRFLGLSLIPMVILAVPVILIMVHLHPRYGMRPFHPNEPIVVSVVFDSSQPIHEKPVLIPQEGLVVETPAVHIPELNEVSWRLRAQSPGVYMVSIKMGEEIQQKSIHVGSALGFPSGSRSKGLLSIFVSPREQGIEGTSQFQKIHVNYSEISMKVLGMDFHWMVVFVVLSILFGFLLKKPLGVEI